MKAFLTLVALILGLHFATAQDYISAKYLIKSDLNISYGSATDVAGNVRDLKMDISYPTNAPDKNCGKPIMIVVHGGAFMSGDKGEASLVTLREEFAKRGYITASVNYRLGVLHTDKLVNCNVSSLGASWNCLNVQDSSEWYRAYYRGIQDVHGAIRYLVNNRTTYKPDANNVFVVGQSAGGFIALGVGFTDDSTEVMSSLSGSMADAKPPHRIYETDCIVSRGLDTSIELMGLERAKLGSYRGVLNQPQLNNYTIRGVGNFYGGVFNDIMESHSTVTPVLYTYHQPNDLIVPIGYSRVYAGFNACAMQFPFNCQGIINRPLMFGSQGIVDLINQAKSNGKEVPEFQFDKTNNNANCAMQIANPSTTGHAFDNYTLRRTNMAKYFATAIDTCQLNGIQVKGRALRISISPNPIHVGEGLHVQGTFTTGSSIEVFDIDGTVVTQMTIEKRRSHKSIQVGNTPGVYFVRITDGNQMVTKRVVVLQ